MPSTSGFEVVGELSLEVLQQVLEAAWDNNIIPHSIDAGPGLAYGPYQIEQAVIDIPRSGLSLVMAPGANNGIKITLSAEAQVEIANPPLPSLTFFDMTTDISVTAEIAKLPDSIDIAIMLAEVPREKVSAVLTSGDPIPPLTIDLITEYVHEQYTNGTIPATQSLEGVSFIGFTADVWVDIYDDQSAPSRRIEVSLPASDQVKIRIPIHLKLTNISNTLAPAPMGVVARLAITADLVSAPGSITARLSTATVDVEDFAPAPPSDGPIDYDDEGTNYSIAAGFFPALETAIIASLQAQGTTIVNAVGDIIVDVPTLGEIETFIADQAHNAVIGQGNINLWTPEAPEGSGLSINDVVPKALADAIAFGINPMADANADSIVNFIPAGRSCGIAIDGQIVIDMIWETIRRPEDEGGFGPDFPPHTFDDVNGHDARLNDLDISLRDGSIHMEGDVTVIDAVLGCIDVDASFSADAGLEWADNADGTQRLEPFTIGEPDVDLSLLAWILSFLIGFITFGLVGGIIVLVALFVIEGIAERIGGSVVRDEVTGQVRGIGAWPQTIRGIGDVVARFENPVIIDEDGILFPDAYNITALLASVTKSLARANGPYLGSGGLPVNFAGGPANPNTTYLWQFHDSTTVSEVNATRTYGDDGVYVARFTTDVLEQGGITTHHLASVRLRNVPAVVDAGPDIVVNEGEEIEVIATFTDNEWLDTHTAVFDWGDDSQPVHAVVEETNDPPQARGTARASHAYCDNGEYTLTVRVLDDDGGLGADTKRITVLNVAPTVDAGPDVYAYACAPITLRACFIDPGWCDTHTGTWDFGDCTPPQPAIIREKHEPPAGIGYAAAAHVYQTCGTFHATCRVEDDDGAAGEDSILVRVVDVRNRLFEDGYRRLRFGTVANEWEPYVLGTAAIARAASAGTFYNPELFIVREGRRSQRIGTLGASRVGIYQQVGANPGWDYQLTAWFHLDERSGGTCRLGVDPGGGANPSVAEIDWSDSDANEEWAQLAVRVTVPEDADAITVFLEVAADERGGGSAYFDSVELIPYPCQVEECEIEAPPPAERVCVDWADEREQRTLGLHHEKRGFSFDTDNPRNPLGIVFFGPDPSIGMLYIPPRNGVVVRPPFLASEATARVISGTSKPIRMEAYDYQGQLAGFETTPPGTSGTVQELTITSPAIAGLRLLDGGGEGALIELCVTRAEKQPDKPGTRLRKSLDQYRARRIPKRD